ncbi:MAG: 2-dehydropantoate 2-reductase [Deferrisomatales bacterium]|nr:2-dehydropantoate 2-reductase [Deferrisomatales bacterium]
MRIGVVGAGAMGCLFGGLLARAGEDVVLVEVLPDAVEALCHRGVRLWEGGRAEDIPVRAVSDPTAAGACELVLVMVKAQHTPSAAGTLGPLLGPAAAVLTLQNGLGAADVLASALGGGRLLVGTTAQGATLLAPGEIRHGGAGETLFGPYGPGGPDPGAAAEAFRRAGIPARTVADPWPAVWRKLAVNCGINAVAALTGVLNGQIPAVPEAAGVLSDAVAEAAAVARGAGVDLGDPDALVRAVLDVARATGANRASMGQDVDARRPTEVDFINGAVVREGHRRGVPTPVNRTLWRLVKAVEAGFGPPLRRPPAGEGG